MSNEALDFLMGSGVPSVTFPDIGAEVIGEIIAYELVQQRSFDTGEPLVWDDGRPRMQVVFTLATEQRDVSIEDDDGVRKLYAKAQMRDAIQQAIRKTGHKGDIVHGRLKVTYTENGEATRKGLNPPKVYTARFIPPAVDLGEPDEPESGSEPF